MDSIESMREEVKNLQRLLREYRITEFSVSENLKREDSLILQVLDRMPFVAYINTRDRCVWVNGCCEKVSGYTREEWLNQTEEEFIEKFHPDDIPDYFYKDFDEFKAYRDPNENYFEYEYRMKNKAGEWMWIYGTCTPLEFDENGDLVLTMGTAIDISARKKAEAQIIKLNEELRLAYVKEKTMLEKQQENLKLELEKAQKEIAAISEIVCMRNESLLKLKIKLESQRICPDNCNRLMEEVFNTIDDIIEYDKSQELIFNKFSSIYPSFKLEIQKRCPSLTSTENKICSLIKLDMRTKEIATLLNISERTVEIHRLNIRKKLNIKSSSSLSLAIQTL
jgi:PAS domain S-box-containing protein